MCRGLIAEKGCPFFASSAAYYEGEITRLQEQHAITEKALQQRYEDLAAAERVGSNTVDLEMDLIRKENGNGKLKASIELMIAAVARSRVSINAPPTDHKVVGAKPEVTKKSHISLFKNFMQRICFLFSHENRKEEQLAKVTIETSETNPYFVPDSALSTYRFAPAPSARSSMERLGSCTPRSVPRSAPPARGISPVPRFALPPRPRYLID